MLALTSDFPDLFLSLEGMSEDVSLQPMVEVTL